MVLRVVGTIVGSTLGFAVMSSAATATSPYAVAALVAAAALLTGCLCWHQYRMAIVLACMTFLAVVLCQYNGQTAGSVSFFVARMLSIIIGCTLPLAVSQTILPW